MRRASRSTPPLNFVLALAVVACGRQAEAQASVHVTTGATIARTVAAMGTNLDLRVTAPDRPAAIRASEAAIAAIEATEARLSTWRPGSELSRLHESDPAEPFALSVATHRELARALHWHAATEGAFDFAIGALLAAYDLRGAGRWPTPTELAAARPDAGADKLALTDEGIVRTRGGLLLDAGGFGKGAALDAAAAALAGTAATGADLDFGGQTLLWREPGTVVLVDPDDRTRHLASWTVAPGSVATSGNGERGRTVDGRRLGHLLDPRTGAPAADFGSVTVWCPRGIDADCLATGLFVLGPTRAIEFADRHDDIECVTIERTASAPRIRASRGAAASLTTIQ